MRTWKPHSDGQAKLGIHQVKTGENSDVWDKLIPVELCTGAPRTASEPAFSLHIWALVPLLLPLPQRLSHASGKMVTAEVEPTPFQVHSQGRKGLLASIGKLILGSNQSFVNSWIDHYLRVMKGTNQVRLGHMPTPRAGDTADPRRNRITLTKRMRNPINIYHNCCLPLHRGILMKTQMSGIS